MLRMLNHNQRRLSPMDQCLKYLAGETQRESSLELRFIDRIKGSGVFAKDRILKDSFITAYHGELISCALGEERLLESDGGPGAYLYFVGKFCIDASKEEYAQTMGRFLNDSGSISMANVRVKNVIRNQRPNICFFASETIEAGNELTFYYGPTDQHMFWRLGLQPNVLYSEPEHLEESNYETIDVVQFGVVYKHKVQRAVSSKRDCIIAVSANTPVKQTLECNSKSAPENIQTPEQGFLLCSNLGATDVFFLEEENGVRNNGLNDKGKDKEPIGGAPRSINVSKDMMQADDTTPEQIKQCMQHTLQEQQCIAAVEKECELIETEPSCNHHCLAGDIIREEERKSNERHAQKDCEKDQWREEMKQPPKIVVEVVVHPECEHPGKKAVPRQSHVNLLETCKFSLKNTRPKRKAHIEFDSIEYLSELENKTEDFNVSSSSQVVQKKVRKKTYKHKNQILQSQNSVKPSMSKKRKDNYISREVLMKTLSVNLVPLFSSKGCLKSRSSTDAAIVRSEETGSGSNKTAALSIQMKEVLTNLEIKCGKRDCVDSIENGSINCESNLESEERCVQHQKNAEYMQNRPVLSNSNEMTSGLTNASVPKTLECQQVSTESILQTVDNLVICEENEKELSLEQSFPWYALEANLESEERCVQHKKNAEYIQNGLSLSNSDEMMSGLRNASLPKVLECQHVSTENILQTVDNLLICEENEKELCLEQSFPWYALEDNMSLVQDVNFTSNFSTSSMLLPMLPVRRVKPLSEQLQKFRDLAKAKKDKGIVNLFDEDNEDYEDDDDDSSYVPNSEIESDSSLDADTIKKSAKQISRFCTQSRQVKSTKSRQQAVKSGSTCTETLGYSRAMSNSLMIDNSGECDGANEYQNLDKEQPEHPVSQDPNSVSVLSHVQLGRGSDRPSRPCPICGKFMVRLTRHIRIVHKTEESVQRVLMSTKQEQRSAFKSMKREGIMKSNLQKIGSRDCVLSRERVTSMSHERPGVVCTLCNGVFARKSFYLHRRHCNPESCFQVKGISTNVFFAADCQPTVFQTEILSLFRNDETGLLCQTEPTIKMVGCKLYTKIMSRKDKKVQVKQTVMTDMRRLATLFQHFRAAPSTKRIPGIVEFTVRDMFRRQHFEILEEACSSMTTSNSTDNDHQKSGLMVSLFYLIRKSARIIRVHHLKKDESTLALEVTEFLDVLDIEKNTLIGGAIYNNNNRRQVHLRKPQQLPPRNEIEQLRAYTVKRMSLMLQDAFLQWNSSEYAELRDLACSRLTLFNARRGGEPARLKLSEWYDAMTDAWIDPSRLRNMTDSERLLFHNTKVMYQTGKGINHLVPVLVLEDTIIALQKLSDPNVRQSCGIRRDNQYLFPSTLGSEGNVSGWHATQRVCVKAGLDPKCINATKMRHLTSTMYAALDIPEDQRHTFYRHMGHSSTVNQNIYQAPLAEMEILRVGSILRELETGAPPSSDLSQVISGDPVETLYSTGAVCGETEDFGRVSSDRIERRAAGCNSGARSMVASIAEACASGTSPANTRGHDTASASSAIAEVRTLSVAVSANIRRRATALVSSANAVSLATVSASPKMGCRATVASLSDKSRVCATGTVSFADSQQDSMATTSALALTNNSSNEILINQTTSDRAMPTKKRNFTRWSDTDTLCVVTYFKMFIEDVDARLPGKTDITTFKVKYPTISYEWMTIRNKVLNEQKAYQKRKRIRTDSLQYL